MGKVLLAIVLAVVCLGYVGSCQQDSSNREAAERNNFIKAQEATAAAAKASEARAGCSTKRDAIVAEYQQRMAAKKYLDARAAISQCADATGDKDLQALSDAAYLADLKETATSAPRKINRTTNSRGTTEQWVYDGGYLYFRDDTLESIQN